MVIATQRPSTDVITGLIKANLPSRVSIRLTIYVASKTILHRAGAERLLGQGDMLFIPPGESHNMRLHGAYLDDDEIGKITTFSEAQGRVIRAIGNPIEIFREDALMLLRAVRFRTRLCFRFCENKVSLVEAVRTSCE